MSASVEHKVEMHQLAQERRPAGRPVWDERIALGGILSDQALSFIEKRDAIAGGIKASSWYRGQDEFSPLHEAVDSLADAEDEDEFDGWWDEVYDLADYDRVWIEQ